MDTITITMLTHIHTMHIKWNHTIPIHLVTMIQEMDLLLLLSWFRFLLSSLSQLLLQFVVVAILYVAVMYVVLLSAALVYVFNGEPTDFSSINKE